MCGFVATRHFDGQPIDTGLLARMRDTMIHRGPDDAGLWCDEYAGLGHRRLSILDLSPAGHQPMSNEDGRIWIAFNGEIYNYRELASDLQRRGHRFRSTSDTEVIVHLYEDEGDRCVEHLNGMFAFVIWDRARRRLFGARDRVGIKPFYYYAGDRQFACASEIKALLEDPGIPNAPDLQAVADYFLAGYSLSGKTPIAGIAELPPGASIAVDESGVKVRQYWDLQYVPNRARSREQTARELQWLLDDAVRIHCRSDVPVGCHLSGGLDSSTIATLAARHTAPLKVFSVRFEDKPIYDESRYARMVAAQLGADYLDVRPTADDLVRLFGSLMWHMDVPIPDVVGFSYYTVARLAADHVKVALTGHGGDELFAGYPAQFQTAFGSTRMFDLSVWSESPGEPASLGARLFRAWNGRGPGGMARALWRRLIGSKSPRPEQLWLALHCDREPRQNPLLHPRLVRQLNGYSPAREYLRPFVEAPVQDLLHRCLYHDLRVYLPHLLMKEDRASMAVSIESRVPLLDYRIVEYLATVPLEQKVEGHEPKALLRRVASDLLPPEIVQRKDKTPFPVPLREWASRDLAPTIREVLTSPRTLDRGILNPDFLRRAEPTPFEQLSMFNVEVWFRMFIDGDPGWRAQRGRASGLRDLAAAG